MSPADAEDFDRSYQRAKRVMKRLGEYARNEYLRLLKEEEGVDPGNVPNYEAYTASHMAQRRVWREIQELTRTT